MIIVLYFFFLKEFNLPMSTFCVLKAYACIRCTTLGERVFIQIVTDTWLEVQHQSNAYSYVMIV